MATGAIARAIYLHSLPHHLIDQAHELAMLVRHYSGAGLKAKACTEGLPPRVLHLLLQGSLLDTYLPSLLLQLKSLP